jgi:hypothetical protein
MSAMPGRHRVVLDVVSPTGVPDGIRFAGNLFTGNKTGYGVEESEMALIMVLRHSATAYGYSDAIWSKYGKSIDAKATPPPVANPFNSGDRMQLSGLAKRGVQFIVCGTASRGLAGRIAGRAAMPTRSRRCRRISSRTRGSCRRGVVGVTHARTHGFTRSTSDRKRRIATGSRIRGGVAVMSASSLAAQLARCRAHRRSRADPAGRPPGRRHRHVTTTRPPPAGMLDRAPTSSVPAARSGRQLRPLHHKLFGPRRASKRS